MKPLDRLAISQVNRRLKSIRKAMSEATVSQGWIKYMRIALNMTLKKLAERSQSSIASVAQAERGEVAEKVTLKTLKQMATAMDCEFVYAFVPKTDIETILKNAAIEKARQVMATADTHMNLENQGVKQNIEVRIKRLASKLLEKGDVW
jgi:predicted DNA-binding mobile mystery protein A